MAIGFVTGDGHFGYANVNWNNTTKTPVSFFPGFFIFSPKKFSDIDGYF